MLHKNPADFPVLNPKAKHLHLMSVDTNDFTINCPFRFFGQDLDAFHFFCIILFLQGTRSEVLRTEMERQRQWSSYPGN